MKELIKFIKSTGIYLIGNILTKAVSFFMLPLYTSYLSPKDYGNYDLYIAYITFLSSILFFDIWGGIMRFMFDYEREEKAKPVTNGMAIFFLSTLVYSCLVVGIGVRWKIPYIGLIFAYGLLTNLAQVVGYTARALGKNFSYALGGLVGTLTNVICNIIFIAGFRLGYQYMYVSYNLGMLMNIIIIGNSIHFGKLINRELLDRKLFMEMFRFAYPLSLNSAAYWFLTSYNKIVVNQQLSVQENGFYAVAMRFSSVIQLVTQCFQMAWQELTFSKAGINKEEMNLFYTKAVNEYIKFMGIGTILLLPFIKVIFPIMINNAYWKAEEIVPFTLLGTLFSCISSFVASIISTIKKNKMLFTTTLFGSIVNILLIHVLISILGVQAAGISFAVGYFIVAVRRIQLLNKHLTITINWKNILILSVWFILVYYVYMELNRLVNFVSLSIYGIIAIYCYRNIVCTLLSRVRRKNI
ncbi:MAG: oligosaccharide flippase family protein [Lachnospiraceae bacterium]|nr:oligosaccharide flippase family protein [Lachnospiraceae bacterium]